jgi:hypothetical protein
MLWLRTYLKELGTDLFPVCRKQWTARLHQWVRWCNNLNSDKYSTPSIAEWQQPVGAHNKTEWDRQTEALTEKSKCVRTGRFLGPWVRSPPAVWTTFQTDLDPDRSLRSLDSIEINVLDRAQSNLKELHWRHEACHLGNDLFLASCSLLYAYGPVYTTRNASWLVSDHLMFYGILSLCANIYECMRCHNFKFRHTWWWLDLAETCCDSVAFIM